MSTPEISAFSSVIPTLHYFISRAKERNPATATALQGRAA